MFLTRRLPKYFLQSLFLFQKRQKKKKKESFGREDSTTFLFLFGGSIFFFFLVTQQQNVVCVREHFETLIYYIPHTATPNFSFQHKNLDWRIWIRCCCFFWQQGEGGGGGGGGGGAGEFPNENRFDIYI